MTIEPHSELLHPPRDLLRRASLFLDLDGTLIEIVSRPDAVIVDQSLRDLLLGLKRRLKGRVVIVSGRSGADLQRLLANLPLILAGSHGAEIRFPDGGVWIPSHDPPAPHVIVKLRSFANGHPGVLIEEKPFGVAIHYRLAPEAEAACRQVAEDLARDEGYAVQPGKKVFELKYHHISKGDALRVLMSVAPMQGGRPIFVGDDQTDESAFDAAAELGGAGILVGPPRATHAGYRLNDVTEALQWLSEHAEADI